MYALFTAVPLVGHLNPLLRQAEELQRRGWRVAVASARELRAHAAEEAPGVPFLGLGPLGDIALQLRRNEAAASADASFARGTSRILRGLGAVWPLMFDGLTASIAADRPDVIVSDLFSGGGLSAADACGVPLVVNNPDLLGALSVKLLPPADHLPFLFSGRSIAEVGWQQRMAGPLVRRVAAVLTSATVGRDLNALRATRGLPRVDVHEMLRGLEILVNGAFGLEYPRELPPNVHMVGPMLPARVPPLPPDLAAWLGEGPPVAYANMGTLAAAPRAQLARMTAAFAATRMRVLWILKHAHAEQLPRPLPSNLRLLEWGPPPAAVLAHPNVRVFVSHCGINSVHESQHAGTPIVGIPMLADQRDAAVRVADAGVGLWLDKRHFTADQLSQAMQRVASEPSFRAGIPRIQQAFAAAGGVRRAADVISLAAGAATAA